MAKLTLEDLYYGDKYDIMGKGYRQELCAN